MTIPQQLHFLRPEAFYAFIPLVLFVVLYLGSKATSLSWRSVCDERLLPYILTAGGKKSSLLPMLLIVLASSISIVALAGPVWKKLPQPVFSEESALIIALDLSQSMLATDVKPSRLDRARLKILDLIKARKGGQTALIVYAATAFVVTPLTDDANTIGNLIPALEPALMPAQGSNMTAALALSSELLQQAGIARGDVLLVTDGIGKSAGKAISKLTSSGHRLSVLGVGTADGGPIPLSGGFLTDASGAIVISRLETSALQRAALEGSGIFVAMQADDSDIEKLAKLFASKRIKTDAEATDLKADIWQEEGHWLLLLVVPLVALWPRKGWLLCLPLFLLQPPPPAYAAETAPWWSIDTENLWLRPDQKAMRSYRAGDAQAAARLFDNSEWKAAAHYKAGEYDQANKLLDSPANVTGYYNKGNALAKLGQYQEAIQAYDAALDIDPANEDARFNRELVEKALQQQQQSGQQQNESGEQSEQEKQQQDQQQAQSQEDAQRQQNDPQSQEQQQSDRSDQKQQGQEQNQDQLSDIKEKEEDQDAENRDEQQDDSPMAEQQEQDQQQPTEEPLQAQQQDEAYEQEDAETVENEQAMQQWLRRIPDDPGGLMRRKFIYQYRQMPNQAQSNEPW